MTPEAAAAGAAGPLNLLKMAVGVGDLDELRRLRARRLAEHGASWIYTRNHPRRAAELLAGGSLYWVIRGQVRARQRITGLSSARDEKGRAYCRIAVAPEIVATEWRAWRPFQGWRYLPSADAPPDLASGTLASGTLAAVSQPPGRGAAEEPVPARLVAELRALGLW